MENNYLKHFGVIFVVTLLCLAYLAFLKGYSSFYISFSFLTGRDIIFSLFFAILVWFIFKSLIK